MEKTMPLTARRRRDGGSNGGGGEEIPAAARAAACRQAFAAMAQRWEGDLLRTARRLCGPSQRGADHARDLVQDALIRAYESVLDGQYAGVLSTGAPGEDEARRQWAWLLRILTNRFINEYRRRRKWEAGVTVDDLSMDGAATSAPAGLRAAPADVPGTALLARTLDEPLERALLALPAGMRVCVVLVEIEGLEYAEAAATLGVPIGTVRSRLSRARLMLQETLAQYARERGGKSAVCLLPDKKQDTKTLMGNEAGSGNAAAAAPRTDHVRFCRHIRPFAGKLVEDAPLRGPAGWFVHLHLTRCRSCQAALAALIALRDRVRALRHSPTGEREDGALLGRERWAAMEAAWADAERQRNA